MKLLQTIKKISALCLAAFLLITSTGVEVNAHYCKTKLISLNIWAEATSCTQDKDTDKENSTNTDKKENSITKQNCCGSKTVFSKTDVESETTPSDLKQLASSSVFSQNVKPLIVTNKVFVRIVNANSPPLISDRSILYQNFRI